MNRSRKLLGTLTAAAMTMSAFAGMSVSAAEYDMMNPPIVEVEQGQLRGYMDEGTYAFLGVPYASVSERFAMPEKPESWEGVRDAQAYGPICPIPKQTTVGADEMVWPHRYWIQNEDCEVLNIWTQSLDTSAKKPVMVFLHGGGFTNGSSIESAAYEGRNLSEFGDVVVVTLNHRLNALGYLDLSAYGEEYQESVNAGVADMVEALKWIQANIEVFGGDPDNVTIFGQSGGGRKVMSILHCPDAEGLVDKAIIQSSNMTFNTRENSQAVAAQTLANLGLDETQVEELKTVPVDDLIAAATEALSQVGAAWIPVLDDGYLSADYCDWAADVPIMVGSVFTEQTSTFKVGDGRKNEWSDEEIKANMTEKYGDKADAILEEFAKVFPEKNVADAYFYAPSYRINVQKELEQKLEEGTAPVFNYLFAYEAPVNGGTTAFHCSDLIYAFHNVEIPIVTRATGGSGNTDALKMQDTVATAWVNFAKTGNPSQEGLEWLPYTPEEPNVMFLDVESRCGLLGDETLNELMTAK
ncbi:MAG: carboxylesterase family protein [Lachnospiraceae bacterium]|nr:carboxylesterase family protein [Robinsoniella sp.]MDY3767041.1 carboxylesterase family protein [Lachnospiraceae bacterium]